MSEEKPKALVMAEFCDGNVIYRPVAVELRRLHFEVKRLKATAPVAQPIDMVLHCPACGQQHIDEPDTEPSAHSDGRESTWENPPHRSHLCHGCGHIWRPADVPTNGVRAVTTKGKADSPIAVPVPVAQPLKAREIIALWRCRSDGPDNAEIVSFARAIERAHGITEDAS